MKISKIEPQKKNSNRCSIYIDGEYRFGLTKDLVLKYDLHEGDEISEKEIKDVLLEEEKQKIKQRAFKLLHYRQRSARELRNRLIKIGFDPSLVDNVIEDFIEDKTIDDERFTKAFMHDYTYVKTKGNKFITWELKKKGITQEIINKMLQGRDEKKLAKEFMKKKMTSLDIHKPKDRQKIIRRLLSHGFTSDVVYGIVNNRI